LQPDETDSLLDDAQAHYGTAGGDEVSQPDEEELRQEQEVLAQITNEATE